MHRLEKSQARMALGKEERQAMISI